MIYDEKSKRFSLGELDKCKEVITDHILMSTTFLHTFHNEEPDDTCHCGKFYYRASVTHSETE